METLRTLAIVGSVAAVGGEALLADTASAAPQHETMQHTLTPAEQARYQRGGLNMANMALTAHATENGWTIYGGDPLFPGGVHSETQLAEQVFSEKGHEAIEDMGLNKAEQNAIYTGIKHGEEYPKHFAFGTLEEKMSYGAGAVIVENDARFEDPRYPDGFNGYELDAKVVTHKTLKEKVHGKAATVDETFTEIIEMNWAEKCANVGLLKILHKVTKKVHFPKKHPVVKHPKTGTIYVGKDAVDSNGKELPVFPTGEFDGELIYKNAKGAKVDTKFVLEHNPQLVASNVKAGSTAKLIEDAPIHDASDWEFVTPPQQSFIVRVGRNLLGWKDKEKAKTVVVTPPPTTTTVNQPPSITIINQPPTTTTINQPPTTTTTTTTTTPPPVPGISISKSFEASFNYDGSLYSNLATKHGDTDEWEEVVTNNGQDTLNAQYTDTPPQGEQNINDKSAQPAQPVGLSVNNNGISTWSNVLTPGESVTFYTYTENENVPCFTNVVNTVDVKGTDSYGNTVTAEAIAYTKEENTDVDCSTTAPPVDGGSGQPLPPPSN